jgi:DNA-binding transcriptional ArsR family regulator
MLNQYTGLDALFHALADPARRTMIERLARGPAAVSELARPLPMSLPAAMQHLGVLEAAGLVRSSKTGRVRTCAIEPQALDPLEQWLSAQREVWGRRLDRLDAYVTTLENEGDDHGSSN